MSTDKTPAIPSVPLRRLQDDSKYVRPWRLAACTSVCVTRRSRLVLVKSVLVGREVEVHLAALQVVSNNVFRLRTRMYSVDFTMGFIENTCFIIRVWILGCSEEIGAMGMESKWVLFVAKKRSAAPMPSRFIIRTTFVREAEGKLKYSDY